MSRLRMRGMRGRFPRRRVGVGVGGGGARPEDAGRRELRAGGGRRPAAAAATTDDDDVVRRRRLSSVRSALVRLDQRAPEVFCRHAAISDPSSSSSPATAPASSRVYDKPSARTRGAGVPPRHDDDGGDLTGRRSSIRRRKEVSDDC